MSGPHTHADDPVVRALARASGVLPDQGPIGVFVHHNTLHAYQHHTFHEAVQEGAEALGAEPYLTLPAFRAALRHGRIEDADVRAEIARALTTRADDRVIGSLTRAGLWHLLLTGDVETDDAAGLEYTVHAGIATQCEDLLLWRACVTRTERGPRLEVSEPRRLKRHRDVIVACGGPDTDEPVHGELVRLSSGFLDHGHASSVLPRRDHGFLAAVCALYAGGAKAPRACRGAEADMRAVAKAGTAARTVIDTALEALGVRGLDVEPYLFATALALPGWAGMFARLERNPHEHAGEGTPALADFLAIRLLLERRAIEGAARHLGLSTDWPRLRAAVPPPAPRAPILDAARLWWIARAAQLQAPEVEALTDAQLLQLWDDCAACRDVDRRRVFHEAYERTYRRWILDAVAARRRLPTEWPAGRPRAQFVFCIDEREESIRRAVEEQDLDFITYGAAGFFGVAIDYQGLYDKEPAAHCPVVVTPAHEVYEEPVHHELGWHDLRQRLRDRWLGWERRVAVSSRTLTGGAAASLVFGPTSALNTLAQVVAPRLFDLVSDHLKATVAPRPATRLSALREPSAEGGRTGKPIGFLLAEAADRVTATLRNIGLIRDFAPIVVFLGHGSTSLNNPHESAHDCGACGGRRGGANARLIADMANRPDVREAVRQRGIAIPADTWFVGALHDTADDDVKYYDLDLLPTATIGAFEVAAHALDVARRESARERCRRFDDAPLDITADAALRHVERRSKLLAQPRPEYGHCTNAICIVGRRTTTRGLHLDRRAFLVSYDATQDQGDAILERILAAVGPVGAGISLEYYFSSVDNETFGCGTKLPHNVTGLIGVMNGHQSDLRTGLPLQMIEIHEPMRLLLIVESTPAALLGVASRQAEVAELVVNRWVQLVSLDPETGAMQVFEDGGFVPYVPSPTLLPVVERSPDWHMQSRAHLRPALVRRGLPDSVVGPGHHGEAERVESAHA